MTSDIDDLLELLRAQESAIRELAMGGTENNRAANMNAACLARWIAAVEELRKRAAYVIGRQASATANEDAWLFKPECVDGD